MVGLNMDGPARDQVMKLIQEKDRIESEIRQQNSILQANNVGLTGPLVDVDGFPRNDINVYEVRHARHKILCLQNDHKNIMKQIEKGLSDVHAQFLGNGEGTSVNGQVQASTASSNEQSNENNQSFAEIGFVQEGSPADLGGLCENDEVLQFGSVNHSNFTDITQVHNIVSHSIGQPIQVRVRRETNTLNITVVPRPWAQPGLLGCQIRRQN